MAALNGWHPGEQSIQRKLGFADSVATNYTAILADLPPEHSQFYETCLPFIPVTTLDEDGRPWGSIMAGTSGAKGFVHNKQHKKLIVQTQTWEGDPLAENLKLFERNKDILISGIGVEFSTRQRNKFAGIVTRLSLSGLDIQLELLVNQAITHCPKYINIRDLEPRSQRNVNVIHNQKHLSVEDRLPDDVIDFILAQDTIFLGTSFVPPPAIASKFPPHVAMNHRGGLPGFIRVRNNGRTLVLPDYSGNRMMNSLGNIESTPLASLTLVDFSTGDILYLTGTAKNIVGPDAHNIMPFQNALTLIDTTGVIFVRNALPSRQREGTVSAPSPYSPPVRLLTEEAPTNLFQGDGPNATLTKITIHSPDVMTFTWQSSTDIQASPGHSIILDCSGFLGAQQYQHMAPLNPVSVNDDRVRTWTISSASAGPTRGFAITLRHKVGGALTTAFFAVAHKLKDMCPELLDDTRSLGLAVRIAGVTGTFTIPSVTSSLSAPTPRNFVWFAGGIGVTPFLSLLEFFRTTMKENEEVNIHLFLSARDAGIILSMVFAKYEGTDQVPNSSNWEPKANPKIHLKVDVLHSHRDPETDIYVPEGVELRQFAQRLDESFIEAHREEIAGRDVYICGPDGYAEVIARGVKKIGVESDHIQSESFSY